MKFSTKNYKISKTKSYIKDNNVLFFFNGVNKNSKGWLNTEQNFKKINLKYYKVFNKTTKEVLNNSIYNKTSNTVNGITFFIRPEENTKIFLKSSIVKDLKLLLFTMLTIKINNFLYSASQLNKSDSLNYNGNNLLLCQFNTVYLKKFNSLNFSK